MRCGSIENLLELLLHDVEALVQQFVADDKGA
jgi:hypothetical protein